MEQLHKKHKKWINEFLVPNLIENQKLTACKIPKEHIEFKSIEIKKMSLEVAFMVTVCYFVRITVNIKKEHEQCDYSKNEISVFDIVVKFSPELEPDLYENFNMKALFSNEIIAYEFIIPKIESLSKSPKYFYSHNKYLDAVIALSNFSNDGWKMSKSKANLSLDHIFVAVKELGQFHGEMYALKLTDADVFNSIKTKLVVARFAEGSRPTDVWNIWLELGIRRATNSVRISPETRNIVPESFLKRLEEVLYEQFEYRRKRLQPIEPIAIICHGDYLRNNIAFRYNDNGEAIEAMMFDFQTLCYTSPMIDLSTFIANSTGYEVRNKHFSDIFAAYHESLIETFRRASKIDIPDYLTYENMLKEYTLYLPFGLSIAASFLQTLHSSGEPNFGEHSIAETIREALDQGGETVNAEFRSLIVDIYNFHDKFNLSLEKL